MSKFRCFLVLWLCINVIEISGLREEEKGRGVWDLARPFVKRKERRTIFANENGQVTAARVSDRVNGSYLLHFITLEPNSLFLPVLLHADMVFYVHTGAGRLGWNEDDNMRHAEVRKGDVYRLPAGTVFFAQSSLESERQKLRIYAIFATSINDLREPATGPYTSLSDLVLGFDKDVLQAAFQVPEDVIEDILSGAKQPPIIHGQHEMEHRVTMWDKEMKYVKQLVGNKGLILSEVNKKKDKKDKDKKDEDEKMYNIMEEDKDFENCNGWSLTVTRDNLDALKGSDIGIFMVNLTKGSMMGPHWNRMATEIAIVLEGQGMVRVVCPKTNANLAECRNRRFHVHEGDVFVVPRFHPMTQIAFNNGSFVFVGFSTSAMYNNPQFLAGKASVFRALNVDVVAASFNVTNTTITQLFGAQEDLVILECVSCAGEELRIMEEEIEREMDERRKKEEAAARKEEEERRQEEEEEKARREEEERKQREEEEAREEEEERRREEEARKEEEGEREEEEKARREEEERKQREEEEAREEEEERRREEEARKEEEGEREEEEKARREEEERKQREEEEAREEEEERRREEEARKEEEGEREEEEKARREEEERKQREEEEAREEEEERRREEEEEEARKEEEEAREREEEEKARREEEERKQREEEEVWRKREQEERREEEEAHRGEGGRSREDEEERRQERARRAEEEAKRAAKERDRRAQEEARRAAEEERERERRQWEPQEGKGDRGRPGRRQWEPQEGRGDRREPERRQWEPQEGRGSRGERKEGGRSSEDTRRAAEEERERERRQWEPQEGRGGRGEQRRRQWEHQGGRGSRGEREEGWRGKWDDERRQRRLTI
ncbi:hypothetical protein LIER_28126 [Lithospermum erythrorhizon]|uniref:Cupin type-1 domain-containing protein n=1 Tax=Lithospermum erythrorhizon TaxID=34254 RepID=A0AAV3RIK8_LITER